MTGNPTGPTGQQSGVERSLRGRLRAGEPSAFAELFDAHAGAIYRHGLRLTADRALAEDIVSTTFLHAWRRRHRIDDDGGPLLPWLLGIATNVIRNATRTRRRLADLLARVPPRPDVPDFADEVAARLDDTRTLDRTREALRALRPHEREVVALCVWEGLDYATAAQALGVPVGTVRSRLSRARRRLRSAVQHSTVDEVEPPPGPGQRPDGGITALRSGGTP